MTTASGESRHEPMEEYSAISKKPSDGGAMHHSLAPRSGLCVDLDGAEELLRSEKQIPSESGRHLEARQTQKSAAAFFGRGSLPLKTLRENKKKNSRRAVGCI
jgi:hypothetical protein